MLQYLYEIIYKHDGVDRWTCVQAENVPKAIAKLEKHEAGNIIEILNVRKTFAADASAIIQ